MRELTVLQVEEGECDTDKTIDLTSDSQEDKEESMDNSQDSSEVKSSDPIVQPVGTGTIAKTDTGTPIVEMFSPFSSVPSTAAWGVDMSEHVAFENLPNYTGNWDKMKKGVIQKIRDRKPEEEEEEV